MTCAQLQTQLDAAYAAQLAALQPGYTLDTGQGRQSVVPVDLDKITATITMLENKQSEMGCVDEPALITGSFQRHG